MRSFVLTGGIGAGKSAVLSRFVELGAYTIDADRTVTELQQPGEVVFDQIAERFGESVVTTGGELDRSALAQIVFNDPEELADLEAIVHPAVKSRIEAKLERIRVEASDDAVVVIDIPLVVNRDNLYGADGIIVVDCPIEIVLQRLVGSRGLSPEDARSRIENQISRVERRRLADFVVDNSGSRSELETEIQRCWEWMYSTA